MNAKGEYFVFLIIGARIVENQFRRANHVTMAYRRSFHALYFIYAYLHISNQVPGSLVVRIPRSHRGGRGSIPRLGNIFAFCCSDYFHLSGTTVHFFLTELLADIILLCSPGY